MATAKTTATKLQEYEIGFVMMNSGPHSGEFRVHIKGCRSLSNDKKRSSYDIPVYTLVTTRKQVIMEAWDDQIRDTWENQYSAFVSSTTDQDDGTAPPQVSDPGGDDYALATYAWLQENTYASSVHFHTCLDALPDHAEQVAKNKTAKEKVTATRKLAKQTLATLVAEAAAAVADNIISAAREFADPADPANSAECLVLSGFDDTEDIKRCISQWLHGMPTDRDRFLAVLPRPDRSDWR